MLETETYEMSDQIVAQVEYVAILSKDLHELLGHAEQVCNLILLSLKPDGVVDYQVFKFLELNSIFLAQRLQHLQELFCHLHQ